MAQTLFDHGRVVEGFGGEQLAAEVAQRFRVPAGGGRATNPDWTERRLIPLSQQTLYRLEEMAGDLKVAPLQVAAMLLEQALGGADAGRVSEVREPAAEYDPGEGDRRASILPEGTSLTFADYFKLTAEIEDVLGCFGYSYRFASCTMPRREVDVGRLAEVRSSLEAFLPRTSLTSEIARREFLIAPVLMEVVRQTEARIKVEYSLAVESRLQGSLDYFLRARHSMLVVEAKQGDLQKGFKQLAAELVALDRWAVDSPEPRFYGAVSTGDVWKFGFVDRAEKRVVEDINTYSVPKDLEQVFQILASILVDP